MSSPPCGAGLQKSRQAELLVGFLIKGNYRTYSMTTRRLGSCEYPSGASLYRAKRMMNNAKTYGAYNK